VAIRHLTGDPQLETDADLEIWTIHVLACSAWRGTGPETWGHVRWRSVPPTSRAAVLDLLHGAHPDRVLDAREVAP